MRWMLILLLTVGVSGCTKASGPAPKPTDSGQNTLAVGDRFKTELTSEQLVTQNFMGLKQTLDQTVRFLMTEEITKLNSDGTRESNLTFDRIKVSFKSQDFGSYDYDSGLSGEPAPQARAFHFMVGKTLKVSSLQNGRIAQLDGCDQIVDEIFDDLGVELSDETADIYQEIEAQFGTEALSEQLGVVTPGLPSQRPIEVGNTWGQVLTLGGAYPASVKVEYVVAQIVEDEVTVTATGEASKAHNSSKRINGVPVEVTMGGGQTGHFTLDATTGITLSARIDQKFTGEVTMEITDEVKEAAAGAESNIPPQLKVPVEVKGEIIRVTTRVEKPR